MVVMVSCMTSTVHAQEIGSDTPNVNIGFQGVVSAPSCTVTFNGQSNSIFSLRMPSLNADFFDSNQASPVSRFNIDIAVSANKDLASADTQRQCSGLSASAFQLQFDVPPSALTDSGKLKNTLISSTSSNILVEVLSFSDTSANFQVLNLRQTQILNLPTTVVSANSKSTQLQLGVRYVKDQQSNGEVQAGGFSAYLPFLLRYE